MHIKVYSGVILVVFLGLQLAGCATSQGSAGYTLPQANSASAQTFVNRCSTCHALPHPARHDYAGWQQLLPLMEKRMVERGITPLSDSERNTILSYLKDNARS